jgi:hypothetical protein
MLDKILVFISLIALIAFCGVVVGFVAEPDLIIVTALILALASHDFWITVFRKQEPSKLDVTTHLEALPTGVSGKPAESGKKTKKPAARPKATKKKK